MYRWRSAIEQRLRFQTLLACAYLALALAYGFANPLYESTDEIRHFRYIRFIQSFRALPEQTSDPAQAAQAHHPPLYYLAAALASAWVPTSEAAPVFFDPPANPYWGFRYYEVGVDNKAQYVHPPEESGPPRGNALVARMSRWVSTLFGLGVVIVTYRIGREAFPGRPGLALGATAFVAFNPNFLHLASSINNDVPAAFFSALALLASVQIVRRGLSDRRALILGLSLALGFMTKTIAVAALAPGLLAMAIAARRRRAWLAAAKALAILAACFVLLAGWWFARNLRLYGDLMGATDYIGAWRGEADGARLAREFISNLPYAWTTVWGRFGYGQIPLADWIYQAGGVLLVAAVAGWLIGIGWRVVQGLTRSRRSGLRQRRWALGKPESLHTAGLSPAKIDPTGLDPTEIAVWFLLLITLLSALVAWIALMLTIPATANARMIFGAYPALGLIVTGGLAGWRRRAEAWIAWGLAAAMAALAVVALVDYLAPAYARPQAVAPSALAKEADAVEADLGGVAEILGFRVSALEGLPGDAIDVTVYWKPTTTTSAPLTAFVHLLDDDGILVAQRDTYPGLGNYPTTWWAPGVIFADTYRVYIPDTAYAPDRGRWQVGLYDAATGARIGDAVELASFTLDARPGDTPNPVALNFQNGVELVGYELDRRLVEPGGTFTITAYWRRIAPDSDYWAYGHVVAPDGSSWAISDSIILPPVTAWQEGQVVAEARTFTLAPDTPPGLYDLEFGVTRVDESGQTRLMILADDGHEVDDHVMLTKIRVTGN